MSVTIPVVDGIGISLYTIVLAVTIPITWEPAKFLIPVVLNPDITTLSLLFKDGAVEIYADTVFGLAYTKTTFSKVLSVVLIDVISFPLILLTDTLKPPPFVFVLSNIAASPTS